MHLRSALLWLALLGAAAPAPQSRGEALPEQSPFLPPAGAAPAAAAADAGFDLVGMTMLGRETLVSILRHADHRSLWIPVGRTVGDITVVSYNAGRDETVIRVGGRELTLPMRKGGVVAGANLAGLLPTPATTSTPAFTLPAKPLTPIEEKEMEARMLVSDLLEIGQQQRKAYEEAQRRAAAAKAGKAAASSPAPPPSPAAPPSSPAPVEPAANPPAAK